MSRFRNKKKRPSFSITIQVPKEKEEKEGITISNTGTLKDGDLRISKRGIIINNENLNKNNNNEKDKEKIQPVLDKVQNTLTETFGDGKGIKIKLEDLTDHVVLGQGASGVVQRVVHEPTSSVLALKSIKYDSSSTKKSKQIIQELRICFKVSSPFIVAPYAAFFDEGNIHIVLEYMDAGTLETLLKKCGTIPEKILGKIASQVLQGFVHLHDEHHLIHRDIKPSNLLLTRGGTCKISDFGVSSKELISTIKQAETWVGTVTYMSPERIRGQPYSFNSDLFSLGLTLIELATGKFPMPVEIQKNKVTFWDLMNYITNEPSPTLDRNKFSDKFADFVDKCLIKDPEKRPEASTLIKHSWIKKHSCNEENSTLRRYLKKNLPSVKKRKKKEEKEEKEEEK